MYWKFVDVKVVSLLVDLKGAEQYFVVRLLRFVLEDDLHSVVEILVQMISFH